MEWVAKLGEINLPELVVLVLAFVVVEFAREIVRSRKNVKSKDKQGEEAPTLAADSFAKIMGAVVAQAIQPLQELVANNTDVISNNTQALNDIRVSLASMNAKVENVLGNTNLLLQQRHHMGGDDGC